MPQTSCCQAPSLLVGVQQEDMAGKNTNFRQVPTSKGTTMHQYIESILPYPVSQLQCWGALSQPHSNALPGVSCPRSGAVWQL